MAELSKALTPAALYEAGQKMSSYAKGDTDIVEVFKVLMSKMAVCNTSFVSNDALEEVVASMTADGYKGPVYIPIYTPSKTGGPVKYDLILVNL